jgi:hypothetical protein
MNHKQTFTRSGFNDTAEFGMVYSESNNNSKKNTKIGETKKDMNKSAVVDGYE